MASGTADTVTLFRFYMWNCGLCEAFYLPLQIAEIAVRNAIHKALLFRLGERWFENPTFLTLLAPTFRKELESCIVDEADQHGNAMTAHHICSSLNFGFWEHLTTKRFERMLWNRGIRHNFPNAPATSKAREELRTLIESVRRWRNRIAHHKAIFDKLPSKKHQDTLYLIRWVCNDTADWISRESVVQAVINARPTN
ncbi:MAG TPA: hypothetical protein VG889_23040 [Rhizomicrobium sp.]|nr:hypothetical protein [Rhizomicrobium sp.]